MSKRKSPGIVLGYKFSGRYFCLEHLNNNSTAAALARPIFRESVEDKLVPCDDCLKSELYYIKGVKESV